ncbi:MAG: hypothetical protein ACLRWQ_11010 [Flavonifractor plautii]
MAAGLRSVPVAHKPDSMEICFIPDGDYAAWLDRRGDPAAGATFVDKDGNVLGRHRGFHCYTLGRGGAWGCPAPPVPATALRRTPTR